MKPDSYKCALDAMRLTCTLLEPELDYKAIVSELHEHHRFLKRNYGDRTAVLQLKAYYNEAVRFTLGEIHSNLTPV